MMGRAERKRRRLALALHDARMEGERLALVDRFAATDRAITEALARSDAHDKACLAAIEELPRIRAGLRESPIFSRGEE